MCHRTCLGLAKSHEMKILIIDDDGIYRTVMLHTLRQQGFQAEAAVNASTAQRMLSRGGFEGIVCDVNMPGTDGLTLVQSLRHSGYRDPIVVVSASTEESVRNSALEAGANHFYSKPVNPLELGSLLRRSATVRTKPLLRRAGTSATG